MSRQFLSGNEAIARGAADAGAALASAYPGTPSTEILENIARTGKVKALWAPNEKIAVELVSGASFAGFRVLAAMKHVGVNVAADPLFTMAYTGVKGGMVVVTADDPELHSSQNEQDNRRYAPFMRIPMLEPSDSQETLEYTRQAFALSEQFDLPFFLRTTTRISHGKSVVEDLPWSATPPPEPALLKDPSKYVMVPSNARIKHVTLEERVDRLAEMAEDCAFNRIEWGDPDLGIVTSGVSYNYVKEAAPGASVLKLGLIFPMPTRLLLDFAARCRRILVVEELEPYLEEWLRYVGIPAQGKAFLPRTGELNTAIVRGAIARFLGREFPSAPRSEAAEAARTVPARPPVMCVGCPHRGVFYLLSKRKTFVAGDIGCYTLAVSPPLSAIHTTVCMGAGVNQAAGIEAVDEKDHGKVVAVIGDSTFLHSGLGGVLNMAFNDIPATVIILDNYTTAMTGRQNHPGSGFDLKGNRTRQVDWETLIRGLGIQRVRLVDAYDLAAIEAALKEETASDEPSVIVVQGACMLLRNRPVKIEKPYRIDEETCNNCGICLRIGCPAISRKGSDPEGKPYIDQGQCTGCDLCLQVCRYEAIEAGS